MNQPLPHTAQHGARPGAAPGTHAAQQHGHEGRHDHHGHHAGVDAEDHAEMLDLDAEVLAGQLDSLTGWLPVHGSPRHIVDLGAGTGAGTCALLARFPDAQVIAVDSSAAHLDRLREKAAAAGVEDRVRVVRADLDTDRPDLGTPDLVWASASLHHMADPDRVLRQIREVLAPGGLLAVVELAGFPRFLPADAPQDAPGLEERCHAAVDRHHVAHLPHRGADWGVKLSGAGFTVAAERALTLDVRRDQLDDAAAGALGRYALATLGRLRETVGESLPEGDRTALDRLLDATGADSVARRGDLGVRVERSVWAARP
jgi:SAM-dependent methyltransferase